MRDESAMKETRVAEDKDLNRRRLELEYELAQTGLKGTLIGALAVILMITILAVVSALTRTTILSGTQIVSIFGVVLVVAVAYGAFVYKRLVTVFGKLSAGGFADRDDVQR